MAQAAYIQAVFEMGLIPHQQDTPPPRMGGFDVRVYPDLFVVTPTWGHSDVASVTERYQDHVDATR